LVLLWKLITIFRALCQKFHTVSSTAGVNIINILGAVFTQANPKSVKDTDDLTVFFYAFGICDRKSCLQNLDEIEIGLCTLSSDEFIRISKFRITKTNFDCRIWSNSIFMNEFIQNWPFKDQIWLLKAKFSLLKTQIDVVQAKLSLKWAFIGLKMFFFQLETCHFTILKLNLCKIWPNLTNFVQIRLSNFIKFDIGPQIRPRIRISNLTFWVEFRTWTNLFWNSSEISAHTLV